MSEPRPVRWVSPANAWAIGAQVIAFLVPVLVVTGVYDPLAMTELNQPLAEVWQWVMLVAAVLASSSTLLMHLALGDGSRMRSVVTVEAISTTVVASSFALLFGALVWKYGFLANPLTQLLVAGLAVTALGRVGQIVWELRKYRRALAAGRITRVEALAQAKET
jgi:hypothetical protein